MPHTPGFARLARLAARLTPRRAPTDAGSGALPGTLSSVEDAERPWSRRRFMAATVSSSALALGGFAPGCGDGSDAAVDLEIAVVGGGVAGLHCAARLVEAGLDVVVFERTPRLGGRMYTSRDGHPEGQSCELGGELVDSNHAAMWCLAAEFGLQLDDRAPPPGTPTDTWWVAGAAVPEATVVEQFTAVAPAMAMAAAAADGDEAAYAELDSTTLADWLATHVPPATYPELHAILTSAYRGEFGLETPEQSALNMLYLIGSEDPDPFRIFGDSDERWHIHEGSDALPAALAATIPPERIRLERTLERVRRRDAAYELTFSGPDGEERVLVHHVVFALPFSTLRDVDLTEAGLPDDKLALIAELGYGTNAKVMAWFMTPVWLADHGATGSATTDGPMQQCWSSSIGQDGTHGILTNFLGGTVGSELTAVGARDHYELVVLPEVEALWPGSTAACLLDTVVPMIWAAAPAAKGSYTCYRPGQWATWGLEGERHANLHFCGEHCSLDFQGWMEGAAETGALVAAALLDEYGLQPSPGLDCILAAKLVVEQPAFGRLTRRPRFRPRRERLRAAAVEARARLLTSPGSPSAPPGSPRPPRR